jgi:hypothetical protein
MGDGEDADEGGEGWEDNAEGEGGGSRRGEKRMRAPRIQKGGNTK